MAGLKLDPWQEVSVRHLLAHPRGGLGDEMRVGKTAPTIIAALSARARSVLVLCPPIAISNWEREIADWGRASGLAYRETTWEVESYDTFWRRPANDRDRKWDTIILDEAHYLRTPTAKRSKAVWGERARGDSPLLQHAQRVWILTGTPMVNDATDLWAMFRAMGWTDLSARQWMDRYCHTRVTTWGERAVANRRDTLPELRAAFRSHFLRRTYAEVHAGQPEPLIWRPAILDLKSWPKEMVDLEDELAPLMAHLRGDLESDGTPSPEIQEPMAKLARLTAELMVPLTADHVTQYLQSSPHAKVLVFGWHEKALYALARALEGFKPVILTGKTANRDAVVAVFQTSPSVRVLVGNLVACGTAIDLSAATAVVMHETRWSPGDNVQAAMRAVNRRKSAPVPVDVMGIAGSISEAVARVRARRMQMMTEVYGPSEGNEPSIESMLP